VVAHKGKNRKKVQVTLWIEPGQRAAVEEVAAADGRSFSEIYRQALSRVLANLQRKKDAPELERLVEDAELAIAQSLTLHPRLVGFARAVLLQRDALEEHRLALAVELEETARLREQLANIKKRVTDALGGKSDA